MHDARGVVKLHPPTNISLGVQGREKLRDTNNVEQQKNVCPQIFHSRRLYPVSHRGKRVGSRHSMVSRRSLSFFFFFPFPVLEPLRAIISRCHDEAVRSLSHPALDADRGVDADRGGSSDANQTSSLMRVIRGRLRRKLRSCRAGIVGLGYDMRGPPSTTARAWGKPTVVKCICREPRSDL